MLITNSMCVQNLDSRKSTGVSPSKYAEVVECLVEALSGPLASLPPAPEEVGHLMSLSRGGLCNMKLY